MWPLGGLFIGDSMNTNLLAPYLSGKIFLFRYTDSSGKRHRQSTGMTRKSDAQRYIREFMDTLRSGIDSAVTVREVLALYKDPQTNPKWKQAQVTLEHYSDRYALHVARNAKDLETLLEGSMKKFLNKPLYSVNRLEIKNVANTIVKKYGACNKSAKLYKLMKFVFSQAADDGLLQFNIAQGLPDIKYKATSRPSLPAADIKLVLNSPQVFPNERARRLFTIFATVGLRRSEALALNPEQLNGNVLVIDRAYKDDSLKILGEPKWGKNRALYLSEFATKTLDEAFEEGKGEAPIRVSSRMLSIWFKQIQTHALQLSLQRPEAWENLTPHVLRHSLNTNLRLSGLPDILVSEYMSWEHQGLNAVQEGYTHIYAENLKPVAECIDRMYGRRLQSEC